MQRLMGARYGSIDASNGWYDNDKGKRRVKFKDVIKFWRRFHTTRASLVLLLLAGLGFYGGFRLFDDFFNSPSKRDERVDVLPWNPIYRVPEASEYVGDRSDSYARLRKEIDKQFENPTQFEEMLKEVWKGRKVLKSYDGANYDVHSCPDTPPAGYPFTWKTTEILEKWNADDIVPPSFIDEDGNQVFLHHNSLCIFDYHRDYHKAMAYREAQLPFIVENDPAVLKTVARWNLPHYMYRLLGDVSHRTEFSLTNNFLFHVPPRLKSRFRPGTAPRLREINEPPGWHRPTKLVRMSFAKWIEKARTNPTPKDPHWYFRLISCGTRAPDGSCDENASEFLFDELPFFQPKLNSLYLVDPSKQNGIHCRFGMAGVTAQNHYDSGRNAIALLQGTRRYILSHPDQCSNMALFSPGHPSARHSEINWADPDLQVFPGFAIAQSHEVVLQAGQVLYLPHVWFHHIISLDINMQCNTRSGIDPELQEYIDDCGF